MDSSCSELEKVQENSKNLEISIFYSVKFLHFYFKKAPLFHENNPFLQLLPSKSRRDHLYLKFLPKLLFINRNHGDICDKE